MKARFFFLPLVLAALLIAGAPNHAFAATKHKVVETHPVAAATTEEAAHVTEGEKAEPGLPQLDLTLWPAQAFWLVISFTLLYLLMHFVALPGVERTIAKREDKLNSDIEEAKLLNEQAKHLASDLELRMNDARTRAADQVREVMAENSTKLAAAFAEQQKKLDVSLKAAEAQLATQKQAAIASLDGEAAGMIEAILKRVMGSAPANDALNAAWKKAKEA
jgi:F-type H+-transporting ATPase subunit b